MSGSADQGDLVEQLEIEVETLVAEVGELKATLEAEAGGLKATLETLVAEVGGIKAELGGLTAMLAEIKAGQDNVAHRNYNGMSRLGNHELQPLKAERGRNVGQYPPPGLFPATRARISSPEDGLTSDDLDALGAFYGIVFEGECRWTRQTNFQCFIGAI